MLFSRGEPGTDEFYLFHELSDNLSDSFIARSALIKSLTFGCPVKIVCNRYFGSDELINPELGNYMVLITDDMNISQAILCLTYARVKAATHYVGLFQLKNIPEDVLRVWNH